jgi:NAD+ kinase
MVVTVGGARIKLRVKAVIVITKKHDQALIGMTREVTDFLLEYSVNKKDPYTVYFSPNNLKVNKISYVDQDFETSPSFDYQGLMANTPSYYGRVKFWTPELCLRQPHLFDYVITVSIHL